MFYSLPEGRRRLVNRFDKIRPVRVIGHLIRYIAIAKLRSSMVLRVVAQTIQYCPRGHSQKIQNILFTSDVVNNDIFILKILSYSRHALAILRCIFLGSSIAQKLRRFSLPAWGLIFILVAGRANAPAGVRAQVTPRVVINELMWMGSSSSTADEWIELRNVTAEPIDLTGWHLTKLSGGVETTMLEIPNGKILSANGYFVIANYAATSISSSLRIIPDIVDTDVALSNSSLHIRLYDQHGVLHDGADDGSGNPLSGRYNNAEKIFASMERNPVPGDGALVDSWHTATRAVGFQEGKPELGTPGSLNSNGQPVAVAGDDQTGTVGEEVSFDGTESSDPENQTLTFGWNFGDGATSSEPTPRHAYAVAGEYTVTLTVSDGTDSGSDTLKVTVTAARPNTPTNHPQPTTIPARSSPIVPTTSCRGVIISELFPNPDGVDDYEFIELYNPTKQLIVLDGCSLWVNNKRKAVLKNLSVAAKKYVVIEKSFSKLSLTNTGGNVILQDTDGSELGRVSYPKPPENESWALVKKEWVWTNQVTLGKKNIGPIDDDDVDQSKVTNTPDAPQAVGLEEIQSLEIGAFVVVQGVVTVEPDRLGTRIIFLQSGTGAISAVLPKDASTVTIGNEVELIGKVRLSQGRKRIAVESDGLRVLSQGQRAEPKKITLDQLSPEVADMLVSVSGLISTASGAKFLIDDGTSEADVYLKSSTGIVKPRSASGDRLIVTGIVSVTTSGIRVLPRIADDLRVERVLGTHTVATAPKALPTAPANQNIWYWGLVGLGLLAAATKPFIEYLRKRKKRLENQTA